MIRYSVSLNDGITDIELLISQVALGNREAFNALYAKTSDSLFSLCVAILQDQEQAADCLQEVYVKVWKHAERYCANGLSPMTWLITIARNTAIDHHRRRRANNDVSLDLAPEPIDGSYTPDAIASSLSDNAAIEYCLETLDPLHADVIRGAYLHGKSYADLATANDIPINTIRTWLRRGLQKLRRCLKDD